MRTPAFWDASALVPLCVGQPISSQAIMLYKTHDVAVWWATPIEIASAIARLLRANQLDQRDWIKAHKLARSIADSWSVIQPSAALQTRAIELLQRYELRTADSLQLAAALEWCEGSPEGRIFLTADRKLRLAAQFRGFDTTRMHL